MESLRFPPTASYCARMASASEANFLQHFLLSAECATHTRLRLFCSKQHGVLVCNRDVPIYILQLAP